MSTRVPLGAVTVMTRLPPAILSRSRLVRRKGPRWLVASMSSMPSSLCSYSDAKTAAVLMSASTCATWREIWRAAARTDAFDDRSTSTLVTRLSVSRRVTNASRRSDGLLSSSRRAPRRASSAAVAEPIAPVAPVITTTGCSPATTSVSMHQARHRKSTMRPLIDAHRGECGTPGLPAAERYARAIAMGVDFVEIDIRRTLDGIFFSYHDDHTPSGRAVRDLTYAALENELGAELLKAGAVLEMVDGKVGLHVDVKEEGYEADVVRFVQAGCTRSEVVFTSGDVPIRAIKEQFPNVRTGLSLGDDLDGAPPSASSNQSSRLLCPREHTRLGVDGRC